jgi:hypothetical protein
MESRLGLGLLWQAHGLDEGTLKSSVGESPSVPHHTSRDSSVQQNTAGAVQRELAAEKKPMLHKIRVQSTNHPRFVIISQPRASTQYLQPEPRATLISCKPQD